MPHADDAQGPDHPTPAVAPLLDCVRDTQVALMHTLVETARAAHAAARAPSAERAVAAAFPATPLVRRLSVGSAFGSASAALSPSSHAPSRVGPSDENDHPHGNTTTDADGLQGLGPRDGDGEEARAGLTKSAQCTAHASPHPHTHETQWGVDWLATLPRPLLSALDKACRPCRPAASGEALLLPLQLHFGRTRDAYFNQLQRQLVFRGAEPTGTRMELWLAFLLGALPTVESALHFCILELSRYSAHDAELCPVLTAELLVACGTLHARLVAAADAYGAAAPVDGGGADAWWKLERALQAESSMSPARVT